MILPSISLSLYHPATARTPFFSPKRRLYMLYYGVVFVIIQITRMMGFHGAPDERKLALNSSFILKGNFCHSPPGRAI